MTTHCPIVFDYIVPISKPRARKTDPQTSHDAADLLSTKKCKVERAMIYLHLKFLGQSTMKEIAKATGADKVKLGKRANEVRGIAPTGKVRNGERVWGLI